jgi:hypothetical protein
MHDLRDSVDGSSDLGIVFPEANNGTNIVPTDDNGLVFERSVAQVLPIAHFVFASHAQVLHIFFTRLYVKAAG